MTRVKVELVAGKLSSKVGEKNQTLLPSGDLLWYHHHPGLESSGYPARTPKG